MVFFDFPLYDNVNTLPIYLINMGLQHRQDHIIRKEGYPHYQILYCNHGSGTLIFDDKDYLINENTAFILPPDYPHEYYANEETWDIHWLAFYGLDEGRAILQTLTNLDLSQPSVLKLPDTNRLDLLFLSMHEAIISDEFYGVMNASGILYSFLLEFNKLVKEKSFGSCYNPSVRKAALFVNRHYAENITLETLCDLCKITKQHMCLLFRASLNSTPMEYLNKKRLQEAKILLLTTTLSIEEIATKTGFHSSSYFCKQFKRYEKSTPAKFRMDSFI